MILTKIVQGWMPESDTDHTKLRKLSLVFFIKIRMMKDVYGKPINK